MPAQLHFITGKGGVGKSTLAAARALNLALKGEGPVLLLEVQGSGHSLELLGAGAKDFENRSLPGAPDTWGARILPRDSFKQYFSLLLALGNENSAIAQATSEIRRRVVDLVLENRIVSAFVDVCPGLEPSVLLGKIHWEATLGRTPDGQRSWRHVVVDAPATGHGLMLFRSTNALTEVFGTGPIFKQAAQIMSFIRDPKLTHLYITTTVEELPLQESREMQTALAQMGLEVSAFLVNRYLPTNAPTDVALADRLQDPLWKNEVRREIDNETDQESLLQSFRARAPSKERLRFFREFFTHDRSAFLHDLALGFGDDS